MFAVGSIVRAKRGRKKHRAIIATLENSGAGSDVDETNELETICIVWEPIYPFLISEQFLITPKSIHKEVEQDEAIVTVDSVKSLLSFESDRWNDNGFSKSAAVTSNEVIRNIKTWKERGDQLLRLGDASAATSYYEKSLFDSSSLSIGGSVIISVGGFPRIAEVDCVDDDEESATIDVTFLHNNDEKTVEQSAVLLCILPNDFDNLQERILLNLARCMLQLSDMDVVNRPKYLKSSVLATTLAIAVSSFRDQQNIADTKPLLLPENVQSALVLRCKANTELSKWSNATSDAWKLIKHARDEKKGRKLLASIERRKKLRLKTDKKLAKEICRLVESVTTANESKGKFQSDDTFSISVSPKDNTTRDSNKQSGSVSSSFCINEIQHNLQRRNMPRKKTKFLQLQEMITDSLFFFGYSSMYSIVALLIMLILILIAKGDVFF